MKIRKYCLFIPSLRGGGAEKVVALLASYLANDDANKVYLVVMREDGVYWDLINEKVRIINFKQKRVLNCVLPLSQWIKANEPHVIFSALSHVNIVTSLAKMLSRHDCKLVLSEHSTLSDSSTAKKKLYKNLVKVFYNRANCTIAVSDGVKKDLISNFEVLPNKVQVINNPAYPTHISREKVDVRSFFKQDFTSFILSIGRLQPEKNFLNLLQAFNTLADRNCVLAILGEGKERYVLEKYIIDNNLSDRVILPGFVKDPTKWLNSADVFVSSSNREGFGNAIVEAMACGVNVVSTNCAGPKEILSNGQYGILVASNNPQELSSAIFDVLSNSHQFDKDKLKDRAKEYSASNIFSKYERVLTND